MNSQIILAKNIKVDREYKNVLSYNHDEMLALVSKNKVAELNDYSFIRQNKNSISTNFTYEQCLEANYIAFENKDYSNKWFFAWIDDVIYKGDKSTEIRFTVDAWSTYFGEWTRQRCFVIRHHVNDDTIGLNTVPENIETGEYINQPKLTNDKFSYLNNTYICMSVSEFGENIALPNGARKYNGIYSGLIYLLFNSETEADKYIKFLNEKNKTDALYSIFLVPKSIVNINDIEWITHESPNFTYAFCPYSDEISNMELVFVEKTNYLDNNYVPKNNKLLCYPYKCFNVTNFSGQTVTYKYEDFSKSSCEFVLKGAIAEGCSIKLVPKDYKKSDTNTEEGIDAGKLPLCGWLTDPYINWLTQNGVNLAIQTGLGLVKTVAGGIASVASGGTLAPVATAVSISGASDIASSVQSVRENYIQPEQAHGGSNQGYFNFSNKLGFNIQRKSIKYEYALIIDNYFTRFGYKVNRLLFPNITRKEKLELCSNRKYRINWCRKCTIQFYGYNK